MKKLSIVLFLAIISITLLACWQDKITDPKDPNFEPERFRFTDYQSPSELAEAFRVLFPPGTEKRFVDKVLVENGGAKSVQSKNYSQMWHYWAPLPIESRGPNDRVPHIVIYDENDEVINVQVNTFGPLYPNQISPNDLRESLQRETERQDK